MKKALFSHVIFYSKLKIQLQLHIIFEGSVIKSAEITIRTIFY